MASGDTTNASNDIGKRIEGAAEQAKSTLNEAAANARQTAKDYVSAAQDSASDLYGRAQGNVRDAAAHLTDGASEALDAGRRTYNRGSDALASRVTKQPLEALLLAGAIGYLVGWATNRS